MREAILRAAADLLTRHGSPLSLDEVAAHVGITTEHLRGYFTSIDAVTTALVTDLAKPNITGLAGTTRTRRYQVVPADSVRVAPVDSGEFVTKPDIMSTARLIQECEAPCMEAVRGHLADPECSLGCRVAMEHTGPIAIGADLLITAECTSALGSASDWRIDVHDGFETVAHGQLGFVAALLHDYERRRVQPKRIRKRQGGRS